MAEVIIGWSLIGILVGIVILLVLMTKYDL